jgi:hypothetical protein
VHQREQLVANLTQDAKAAREKRESSMGGHTLLRAGAAHSGWCRDRAYADANVPSSLVAYMRQRLHWDVLFVLEEDDLRRAPDVKHYQLAQQLCRTLVTLDRDYLDDRRFPPASSGGVRVVQAPDERQLALLLDRLDRALFHVEDSDEPVAQPLVGCKLQVNTDWGRD